MGRVLLVLSLLGLLAGGAVLVWGLSSGADEVTLAGGLVLATSLPWVISGASLVDQARNREELARVPGRATILRAWEASSPFADTRRAGLELEVSTDDATFTSTIETVPHNFEREFFTWYRQGHSIPVFLVGGDPEQVRVDDDVWKAERAGEPSPVDEAPDGLATNEPAIGAHVVDGIKRRPGAGRVLSILLVGALPLAIGLGLWANGWRVVGLVVAMVGALGVSLVVSVFAIGETTGSTWTEDPDGAWPDGEGVAEVLDVWYLGRLEVPRVHGFVLRVHAGGRAWEVKTRQVVPVEWMGALEARQRLAVRAVPSRQHRVAIDWAASEHPGSG